MRPPAELVDAFRAQGLKITPQRQLLFRLLHGNEQHPTAEVLHAQASDRMPGISLRTVYQTLSELAAMGELQQFNFDAGPAHFDSNVADHHHTVCDGCGAIADIYVDGVDQLAIDGLDGFRAERATIVLRGSCAACARRDGTAVPVSTSPHQHRPATTHQHKEHQ
jgi:Fe2+ or Zn2+ uptake regulation protein